MELSIYHSLRRYYQKHLDVGWPIYVRRVNLPDGEDGNTSHSGRHFLIQIEKTLSEKSAIDTLIHEIGHCIAWEKSIGHGVAWGIAYSKSYKMYLDWLEDYESRTNVSTRD